LICFGENGPPFTRWRTALLCFGENGPPYTRWWTALLCFRRNWSSILPMEDRFAMFSTKMGLHSPDGGPLCFVFGGNRPPFTRWWTALICFRRKWASIHPMVDRFALFSTKMGLHSPDGGPLCSVFDEISPPYTRWRTALICFRRKWASIHPMVDRFAMFSTKMVLHSLDGGPLCSVFDENGPPCTRWRTALLCFRRKWASIHPMVDRFARHSTITGLNPTLVP
jgi:hypothetical protein